MTDKTYMLGHLITVDRIHDLSHCDTVIARQGVRRVGAVTAERGQIM